MLIVCQRNYTVVGPDGGQRTHVLPYPRGIYRINLRGNQTGGLFTMTEGLVWANEDIRTHFHINEEETVYVINGTLQVYLDGDQFCAPAGTTVHLPRNVTKSMRNIDSKPAKVQLIFSPSNREFFLEQITAVYDQTPINYTRANELAVQYGQIFLPAVQWKDLNCVSAADVSVKSISYIILLLSQFYFFVLTSR